MYENSEIENKRLLKEVQKRERIRDDLKTFVDQFKQNISTVVLPTALDEIDNIFCITNKQPDLKMSNQEISSNSHLSNNIFQTELSYLAEMESFEQVCFSIHVNNASLLNGILYFTSF
jgi:hypothetical protein